MLRNISLISSADDSESMQNSVTSMTITEPCDRAFCQMKVGASFIEKVDAVIVSAQSVVKMQPSLDGACSFALSSFTANNDTFAFSLSKTRDEESRMLGVQSSSPVSQNSALRAE